MDRTTLGVIVGNRDFFSRCAGRRGAARSAEVFGDLGIERSCSMKSHQTGGGGNLGTCQALRGVVPRQSRADRRGAGLAAELRRREGVAETLKLADCGCGAGSGVPRRLEQLSVERGATRSAGRSRLQPLAAVRHTLQPD